MLITELTELVESYSVSSLGEFYSKHMTDEEKILLLYEINESSEEKINKETFEKDMYSYTDSDDVEITAVLERRRNYYYKINYRDEYDDFLILVYKKNIK